MDFIRKFNRFELKYLLPYKTATDLKQELIKYTTPDHHGQKGKYGLSSLYYDSEDYRFYWEKIEGIKFRRKFRIRRYFDNKPFDDNSIVFLEIKQRIDRVTQKRRVPMKYKDALLFCNKGILPEYTEKDGPVIDEIYSMFKTFNLQPSVITAYNREAFQGTDYDAGLRVTFDSDITCSYRNLDLAKNTIDSYVIPPKMVIMEIKTNERIPYWITELVSSHNFHLIRVSKYCQGLEVAESVPKSIYHIS